MSSILHSSSPVAWLALGVAVAGAHCAPRAAIEGRSCPCADGYRCCAAADVCVATGAPCPVGPTGGPGGVAATPASVARLCGAEHGPALAPPRTAAAFGRMLGRRWYTCAYDPKSTSGLVAHEGIELTLDGRWYFLKRNGNGYERSSAPADTGSYRIHHDALNDFVAPTDTTPGYDLFVQWTNSIGPLDLHVTFEQSPLRFQTFNGVVLDFVALDEDRATLVGAEGGGASCTPPYRCLDNRRCGAP